MLLCTKIKENTSQKCKEFTGHVKGKKQRYAEMGTQENIKKLFMVTAKIFCRFFHKREYSK